MRLTLRSTRTPPALSSALSTSRFLGSVQRLGASGVGQIHSLGIRLSRSQYSLSPLVIYQNFYDKGIEMENIFNSLKTKLLQAGLTEAENHFSQAKSAIERSEWEAANSQVRATLESLFNSVAAICLKTQKRGGVAREELERAGILRFREARLIQEFMAYAGGSGSHAGTSSEDEAMGQWLIGAGIANQSLRFLPSLVKVEDALKANLPPGSNDRTASDNELKTKCPTCGTMQFLSEATISKKGSETIYTCINGCQAIVIGGDKENHLKRGRGYQSENYFIRNAEDLFFPPSGNAIAILLPKCKHALMPSFKF